MFARRLPFSQVNVLVVSTVSDGSNGWKPSVYEFGRAAYGDSHTSSNINARPHILAAAFPSISVVHAAELPPLSRSTILKRRIPFICHQQIKHTEQLCSEFSSSLVLSFAGCGFTGISLFLPSFLTCRFIHAFAFKLYLIGDLVCHFFTVMHTFATMGIR
ncbi:hypothetical protein CDAR_292581 [Caerostris darwini]|uniref:Uncharacterized protein n=1 Tax=Caerostris darwini TaxID=1538125 RepID=A0AAV4MNC1_9ARAC|nr:hypothetical protein CDAR_292581 [Caerostris darwini]